MLLLSANGIPTKLGSVVISWLVLPGNCQLYYMPLIRYVLSQKVLYPYPSTRLKLHRSVRLPWLTLRCAGKCNVEPVGRGNRYT